MKFALYLKDKTIFIILDLVVYAIIALLFEAFEVEKPLAIVTFILLFGTSIAGLLFDYFRKRSFYRRLVKNAHELDKSYLVGTTIEEPDFYEGRLIAEVIYEMSKAMNEEIKELSISLKDFKEYLEMWIHEVKIPLSALELMAHNHKKLFDHSSLEQLRRVENYVDQVLYYVRQESSEKDYLIKKTDLKKVVTSVALKNKDQLLEGKISLLADDLSGEVYTDSKWLEFVIDQIISNAIKYRNPGKKSRIEITTTDEKDAIALHIEDNGLGIKESDLPRVFDKSFTGYNGRRISTSTGMGLYIVKNLIQKLGHKIEITSKENEFTRVTITFSKHDFYTPSE